MLRTIFCTASRSNVIMTKARTRAASTLVSRRFIMAMNSNTQSIMRPMAVSMRFYSADTAAPKLNKDEVTRRVVDVIKAFSKGSTNPTVAGTTDVNADTLFHKDLGLDSLDTVELLVAVEEEFDIEIPDKVADELKSVGETIDYIVSNADAN
ncbi:acyl carrier protein NDAI_0J02560 [Naumovozyma dairenensis CBS 421]|uniref:Acyl carrier protein n=1 Tax=Naumovozyma dairenensis (strain ATCC 10597 / BCRC 20456 / CBS 421 / NBRC 0211 / NRRL Y-12639) TaxID=1071378 RepID=G0WH70_NAUDC|nr:hypothetical protein NDAI_0J02560 [Naumovozyma dairenensis CBS 421]CCD27148.1 hypothetical protein NDAI_0J02560 [Naumovozyma dairenensis CBS 421]